MAAEARHEAACSRGQLGLIAHGDPVRNADFVAVASGAFADPSFPAPSVSVWEERRFGRVGLPEDIEHIR